MLFSSQEFRQILASPESESTTSNSIETQTLEIKNKPSTVVIGIFNEQDFEEEVSDTFSVSSWGQFQAAADSLRGHSSFYATSSIDVISTFKLETKSLPAVYMIAEEKNKIIKGWNIE